jgi:ribonuclease-3
LEFLGDAVFELAVKRNLFNRFPEYPEGQLTSLRASLVNSQTMAMAAKTILLEDHIFLSKGESKDLGKARDVILANAMEAVIGAVYLDKGYESAEVFIEKFIISPFLDEIIEKGLYRDPKSHLQEIAQEKFKLTPIYQIVGEEGPDHKKLFKTGVFFGDKLIAEGEGLSKQDAEIEAAKEALKLLN